VGLGLGQVAAWAAWANGRLGNTLGIKLRLRMRERRGAMGRCMGLAVVDSTLLTLERGGRFPIGFLLIGSISPY
jgi:hypothetical protein